MKKRTPVRAKADRTRGSANSIAMPHLPEVEVLAAQSERPDETYETISDRELGGYITQEGVIQDGAEILSDDVVVDSSEIEPHNSAPFDSLPIPVLGTRDLIPIDALALYMRELARYPALSREEEHQLAVSYHDSKDLKAAYKLITSNLWLVVKIAREYEQATRNLLDLIQEGNIGLMEAVKNFDPYRGVRLPSYAVWWIKAYIVRYLIANWRLVKIGTTQAQRKLFFNLKKEKEKLEREGIGYSPKLLAERLDVRESDVIEMDQRMGSSDLSVDSPLRDDSTGSLHSVLPSNVASAEEILAKSQIHSMVSQTFEEFSTTLNAKELAIFRERMLSEDKATLQDMSDQLHISKERVRQIENRLKDKLKEFMLSKLGSTIDQLEF